MVTGGTGFLGRYLVERLAARGDRVRALVRRNDRPLADLGTELVRGDLRDAGAVEKACQGVEVVYHVAGVAGIWGAWPYFYETNTLGTEHVIAGCRRHGVGRLVYTSSPSVTFDGKAQEGVDESAPYPSRWLCHYPHSKALAEQRVLAANDAAALRTCSLRPHLIWGPRDPHLVPRLIDRARRGQLRRIGNAENRVDNIYVENAADAHLQAADALLTNPDVPGRAYFISQGEPVNCWQWINEILALAGLPPVRRGIGLNTAWCVGAVLEGVHRLLHLPGEPRMTRFLAAQLGVSHYFDIRRAQQDFHFAPRISLSEGMARLAVELRSG